MMCLVDNDHCRGREKRLPTSARCGVELFAQQRLSGNADDVDIAISLRRSRVCRTVHDSETAHELGWQVRSLLFKRPCCLIEELLLVGNPQDPSSGFLLRSEEHTSELQ